MINITKLLKDKPKVLTNPVYFTAFGFGSGLSKYMPGTMGTLAGVFIYMLLNYIGLSYFSVLLITIVFAILGIFICDRASVYVEHPDHPGIVWDEIVGYLISMLYISFSIKNIIAGFILFRIIDIVKFWPIKYIDKNITGGTGIMLDDILAGVYVNILLHIIDYYDLLNFYG